MAFKLHFLNTEAAPEIVSNVFFNPISSSGIISEWKNRTM